MDSQKTELCRNRIFYHFDRISQIPRGSGNEKEISDYLTAFGRGLGYETKQDRLLNVLIRKPASPGYENAPVIMLQAHMDMVCQKATGVTHDFTKDPIDWVIDGDILSTGGKTTLGADNGVGVAFAMTVLEDKTLRHPELEVLFTVMEEEDFSGAENFDASEMRADYLINLDHANDEQIVCGSCGGVAAEFRLPLSYRDVPAGWQSYRLSVSGLQGGHSGEDIHRGRGNANVVLARLLLGAESACEYLLSALSGGTSLTAIPRDAEAVLCLDPADLPALQAKLDAITAEIQAELAVTGTRLTVTLQQTDRAARAVSPDKAVTSMILMPDGIFQMNELLIGNVDTSDNMGRVELTESGLSIGVEIRSARPSLQNYLLRKMEHLAALTGATLTPGLTYPSWDFRPVSKLRQLCETVYKEKYHQEPMFLTLHAGLEVGYFFARRPSLDAVSLGPNCYNFHSPTEAVSISSCAKSYDYLISLLAAIVSKDVL